MPLQRAILGLALLALLAPGLQGQTTRRQEMLEAMHQRGGDPWPRGESHVVFALPGSQANAKGYLEPGGGFSPAFGTFGFSLWFQDPQGVVKASSDTLAPDQIQQRFYWGDPRAGLGITTDTPDYTALWSLPIPGLWKLDLTLKTNTTLKPSLVVRSAGPSGGFINALDWAPGGLLINRRWTLKCQPLPEACHLVQEGTLGWIASASTNQMWVDKGGWGCARLELAPGRRYSFILRDSVIAPQPALAYSSLRAPLELSLPDANFVTCLHAQVAHLLMGLAGREPRVGEPNQTSQVWMRGGAQTVVALAQAGQVQVAQQVAIQLAEQDFLGGFGPEADNPGLALWALAEVSARLGLSQYDHFLYPHVLRKARLIIDMRVTDKPIYKPVTAPVLPANARHPDLILLCEPAKNGLIHGKVAWDRPLLYVNAVSFRGLLGAAEIADRVGDTLNAGLWRSHAADLRREWNRAFQSGEANAVFNSLFALWPAQIVIDRAAYFQTLQSRWSQSRDPQGRLRVFPSYGSQALAETHQWLYLNHTERVWSTLLDFWDKQTSPGLYAWGEDLSPAATSAAWEQARGWVKPTQITPHYGLAAEMLMLQMDMLAVVDESGPVPTLVIGPGVPADWIAQPLRVRGLPTRLGWVEWSWAGGSMRVSVSGSRCPVRLGASFPANAPVHVL